MNKKQIPKQRKSLLRRSVLPLYQYEVNSAFGEVLQKDEATSNKIVGIVEITVGSSSVQS